MVNVGGPSKGCVTCIQRKIRCDRQRPICGQCQRSKRTCGGYRDATDIMFRDQSQAVSDKARAASQSQASIPEQSDLRDTSNAWHMTRSGSDISLTIRSPKISEESGLIDFFANNFTCSDSNKGSNLFWVPQNFHDLLNEDCTRFSVQSVGAMALARLHRSAYHHREAQKNYGLALLSLTTFWQQHVEKEVVKDAVLVTILFLGFFEILASYDSSSRQSWTTHVGGLGLLLNKREEQQQFLRGEFGAKMLLQSRSQAILSALQTKTPVNEAFRNPAQRIGHFMPPTLVQSDNADILLIRLATLQAHYQELGPSNALLSDLTALDNDFHRWTESVPPTWTFSTQLCENPSQLWWEVRCDIYPTAVVAHVWNKIRAARIVIHDLTQEISSHLSLYSEDDFISALDSTSQEIPISKIQHLVIEICATISLYYRPSSAMSRPDATGTPPLIGTTYWLLWPLEIIGSMREAPVPLKEWIQQCLERIYNLTGNMKAQLVASRLKARQNGILMP